MSAPSKIVVVGGGLAGITAAIALREAGAGVTLLETRPRLGGATTSFSRGGLMVDNGQHVFLRCCVAYRGLLARLGEFRRREGTAGRPFEVHVISMDAYSADGVRRLEERGVTDAIVGFRWPYQAGPDAEPLAEKIGKLRRFAEDVIAKVS